MHKISEGVAVLFRLLIQDINGQGLRASDNFVYMINVKLLYFYYLPLNFVYSSHQFTLPTFYACGHACIQYTYVCVNMHVCMYAHMGVYVYIHTYIQTYECIHI